MNADNTNRDQQTRKYYIDLAKQYNVDIRWSSFCISLGARPELTCGRRCFHFTGSLELAWHNNLYRAYNMPPSTAALQASRQHFSQLFPVSFSGHSQLSQPKRDVLPFLAFRSFSDHYEEPQVAEGLSEIKKINWVFEGNDEERRHWSMWLQIDGK